MREQKGYVFHKGSSWFVRYCDDVMQKDGSIARKLVCKKLDVEYAGKYRTRASVKEFAKDKLAAVNSGNLDPKSTMLVSDFIEKVYLLKYVEKELRPASQKQYRDVWNYYLKVRVNKLDLMLRDFRTMHGQDILDQVAEQTKACRSSLKHCKSFLSGAFSEAKRAGYLDAINPITGVRVPKKVGPERDTYAYSLSEIRSLLAILKEPARTVVLTAAFSGLRKSELLGLTWDSFTGTELRVQRSIWNGTANDPKTPRSKSAIPVIKQLAESLESHRLRMGRIAVPSSPIFQNGLGGPLNLDNLVGREIRPALQICKTCQQREDAHKPESHLFVRDESVVRWHGWHAFRRGLATNLHALGVDDKTIQAILRHDDISTTMNVYVKTVAQSSINAMDLIRAELENGPICNELATSEKESVN